MAHNSCDLFICGWVKGRHIISQVLEDQAVPIEKVCLKKQAGKVIHSSFRWQDIGSLRICP